MRQTPILQPDYAGRFRCLGSSCDDTCCSGWRVSLSEDDYRRVTSVPDVQLRSFIDASILRSTEPAEIPGTPFATIRMLPSGECPLLSPDKLCRVQLEHGASYLCGVCATYPRKSYCIDGLSETELSLSCPEAARMVLLSPSLIPETPAHQLTWDETDPTRTDLRTYFWQIRKFSVRLILNRRYPLWQRLFLLGTFCRRLDAFASGDINRSFADLLDDFSRAIAMHDLGDSMDSISPDIPLQLEIVLSLIAQRVNGVNISPRARRILDMFVKGLRHTRTASIEAQSARYADAYRHHYQPFFRRHPHILENLLVNAILRDAFPFGKALTSAGGDPQPANAFLMLTIQFGLIKGLLIGVSAARAQRFSAADVVKTVQIASRLFEHNPRFLQNAQALLQERGLSDPRGLTMLLRN